MGASRARGTRTGPLRLGLMGFGEAGYFLAKGLREAGLHGIVAYSPSGAQAGPGHPLRRRAARAGVTLLDSPRVLCERADLILAVTQGSAALPALRSVLPHLRTHHVYVDASTASVREMERAGRLLEGRAGFADAAMMGTVPLNGIKVVTLASGPSAQRFRALLAPYGMNIRVVGERAGAASALKLIRSVFMKGLAGLLLESLDAAQRFGMMEAVAADIAGSMDERPFAQIIERFVCGTVVHGERRVHETRESLALLRRLGTPARMTRATHAVISEIVAMNLRAQRDADGEQTAAGVIAAVVAARTTAIRSRAKARAKVRAVRRD